MARSSTTGLWREIRRSVPIYLLISPFFLIFGLFMLFPILFSVVLSFCEWNGFSTLKFTGLHNLKVLLADARFWNSLRVTGSLTIVTVGVRVSLAIILANILNSRLKLQRFFRTIFFLPTITSMVVISIIWRFVYNPYFGYLNHALSWFGLQGRDWLGDPAYALPALMVILIWTGVGYDMVLYLAGLQSIPPDIYESAIVDGAHGFERFRYITLPMLRPITIFITVAGVINTIQTFIPIKLMTDGGPFFKTETIVYYLYENGFSYLKFGYASAIGLALFILTLVASFVQMRVFGEMSWE